MRRERSESSSERTISAERSESSSERTISAEPSESSSERTTSAEPSESSSERTMSAERLFDLADLERAVGIVRPHVPVTPTYAWPLLAAELGTEVWVKHENTTPTGAFQVRGGLVLCARLR